MRALATAFALAFAGVTASADINGAWSGLLQEDGQIHLQLSARPHMNIGDTNPIARFDGLTEAAVRAPKEQAPVTFRLAHEAGTLTFEGTFRDGMGGGQFRFVPNSSFRADLRALGLDLEVRPNHNEDYQSLNAALLDVSTAYIRSMQKIFPDITFREAMRARGTGATAEYVAALRAERVQIGSIREATRLAGAGVTVKLVRDLASAGYTNISARDLIRLASHGIDSSYISEMSKYKTTQ